MVFYIRTKEGKDIMEVEAYASTGDNGIKSVEISTAVCITDYSILLLDLKNNKEKSTLTVIIDSLDNIKEWFWESFKGGARITEDTSNEDLQAIKNHIEEVLKLQDKVDGLELIMVED